MEEIALVDKPQPHTRNDTGWQNDTELFLGDTKRHTFKRNERDG